MTTTQIQSLKLGQLSLALKLKRQHTAGLVGAISLYKSYSEGKPVYHKTDLFLPEMKANYYLKRVYKRMGSHSTACKMTTKKTP